MQESGADQARMDRILVDAFLDRRDEGAFHELYRRHAPRIHPLIVRLLGASRPDAEDVIQTVWIRAIERLPDFRWESRLRTWLTGIAINCCREFHRASSRDREHEGSAEVDTLAAPAIRRPIARIDLERAISRLPDGYREVLILHDVEGYTHDEIATLLGIEIGTSKSQLSRARNAMRRQLTESERNGKESRDRRGAQPRREGGAPIAARAVRRLPWR